MPALAEVLVGQGLLTEEQLRRALEEKARSGRSLGASALAAGVLSGQQLLEVLSAPLEEPIDDYVPEGLDPALAELLPGDVALELQCLPVFDSGEVLNVAFANEVDDLELERLGEQTGRQIECFLAEPSLLEAAYAMLYGGGEEAASEGEEAEGGEGGASAIEGLDLAGGGGDGDAPDEEAEEDDEDGADAGMPEIGDFKGVMTEALTAVEVVQESKDGGSAVGIEIEANSPPIVKLVNGMVLKSLNINASDIHIEPQEKELRVRVRVDGEMHALMRLPREVTRKIISRVKIMTNLNITEKRLPQDGRFKANLGAHNQVEFRVNTLPTPFGEKICIRVLGGSKLKGDVVSMGFNGRDLLAVQEALQSPTGLVLVTGPTGSGKTTTLYTMLKELNTPNRNLVTAEDPIEYNLPGLTQCAVKPEIGLTFESALRAFLRQDPDVILVGEIRDKDTAEIATKAAMTGHMVLSTLHTNSAPATVMRLKNIGLDRFLLASALKLVIAQRLVRLLCPHCKAPGRIAESDKVFLREEELAKLARVYRGRGCDACSGIGFKGRRPVFEVLPVRSKEMKEAVLEPGDAGIEAVALKEGMKSLREYAVELAAQGLVSYQEILKVGAA